MRAEQGVDGDGVRQGAARHRLFVEGALDEAALRDLVDGMVDVDRLGAAEGLEAAARALHPAHPTYYFVIDRDHRLKEAVERTWRRFPDPDQSNLLIWRKRELENYFLDPRYLAQSVYCQVGVEELAARIARAAQARLPMDVANLVLCRVRDRLKQKWIEGFSNHEALPDLATARAALLGRGEFATKRRSDAQLLRADRRGAAFDALADEMTGGRDPISCDAGAWQDLICGKQVFRTVVHSGAFRAETAAGISLDGRELERQVIRSVLRLDPVAQPPDFAELRRILAKLVAPAGA